MSGNGRTNVEGIGVLTYQRAIDIARNTEGELNPSVRDYLEQAIEAIWGRISLEPDTYLLSRDEFAVFNFFIDRFNGSDVAERAVARYWQHTGPTQEASLTGEINARRFIPFLSTNSREGQAHRSLCGGGIVEDPKAPVTVINCSENRGACGGLPASALPLFVGRTREWLIKAGLAVLAISYFLLVQNGRSGPLPTGFELSTITYSHHARTIAHAFLPVFQVYTPVLTVNYEGNLDIRDGSSNIGIEPIKNDHPIYQKVLLSYSFANSYNQPFVGDYSTPPCSFDRVSWNLTVVSAGKQFDRLGIVYLGDVEVFRTSTAEPTKDGVEWTYLKDMTSYLSLLKQDQKMIFDLGNLISNVYTAAYNVTLTASYFTANDSITPPDAIIPISKREAWQNRSSAFMWPSEEASNSVILRQNVERAVFTIAATGQDQEEFWWSNALQSEIHTFPQYSELPGYSPFREIQLFIDDMLAGVAWPFPTIFTGGVVPGLWRPIVGIDAFDLKEYEIDITPWLPFLCDGRPHNFSIRVSGLVDDGNGNALLSETTGSYWWISGKIFLWFNRTNHTATDRGPPQVLSTKSFNVSSSIETRPNGKNETLQYRETTNEQVGTMFPLTATANTTTIRSRISRGKDEKIVGQSVFPNGLETIPINGSVQPDPWDFEAVEFSTTQNGTATYLGNTTDLASFSFGTMQQDFTFRGLQVDRLDDRHELGTRELFKRSVSAVNSTVVEDRATWIDTPIRAA